MSMRNRSTHAGGPRLSAQLDEALRRGRKSAQGVRAEGGSEGLAERLRKMRDRLFRSRDRIGRASKGIEARGGAARPARDLEKKLDALVAQQSRLLKRMERENPSLFKRVNEGVGAKVTAALGTATSVGRTAIRIADGNGI